MQQDGLNRGDDTQGGCRRGVAERADPRVSNHHDALALKDPAAVPERQRADRKRWDRQRRNVILLVAAEDLGLHGGLVGEFDLDPSRPADHVIRGQRNPVGDHERGPGHLPARAFREHDADTGRRGAPGGSNVLRRGGPGRGRHGHQEKR